MNKEEAKDYLENYRKMYADLAPERFLEALDCLLSDEKELHPQGLEEAELVEEEYDSRYFNDSVYSKLVNRTAGLGIAKHFYELGKQAGARWMAEQGVTIKGEILRCCGSNTLWFNNVSLKDLQNFEAGEEVIIQIRKKEESLKHSL